MKRKLLIFIISIFITGALILSGCGGGVSLNSQEYASSAAAPEMASDNSYGMVAQYEGYSQRESIHDEIAMDKMATGVTSSEERREQPVADGRKIVSTYYMVLETTDYDEAVKQLSGAAQTHGGYMEQSSVGGRSINDENAARYASFTLRIPAEKASEFLSGLDDLYNVINSRESSEDITDSYYDSTARMTSLEEQRDRLIRLREENTENADLQYLLQIEQEISNVNYQIESLFSHIQRMDKSVSMTTINIELREVVTYQRLETAQQSFGERMGIAVSNSWNNFIRAAQDSLIRVVVNAPYFIVNLFWFAVIIVVILFIVSFVRRRIKRRENVQPVIPEPPEHMKEELDSDSDK